MLDDFWKYYSFFLGEVALQEDNLYFDLNWVDHILGSLQTSESKEILSINEITNNNKTEP